MADYTNYTPEQLQKIYQELPEELQSALFSQDTADVIFDICEMNMVLEKVSQVSEYVGYVLLGLLPPGEFQRALEERTIISPKVAEKISKDLNRLIFLPLKSNLETIYGPLDLESADVPEEEEPLPAAEISEESPAEKPSKDVYREPID